MTTKYYSTCVRKKIFFYETLLVIIMNIEYFFILTYKKLK